MRIGITGHSNLTPNIVALVAETLREVLAGAGKSLVGLTCLARGADQVFARVVLELGGEIEVVLPASDYRARKVKPDKAAEFDDLLGDASTVITMPFDTSSRNAYMASGEAVLTSVDAMVAVWDGQPADGHGGTGEIVNAAKGRGLPVTVVWPAGAARG
jgi:hypothetical protein